MRPDSSTGSSIEPAGLGPSAEILRRRQLAARARRRRLLLADLSLGLLLALLAVVLAPGLAWVGLVALLVLALCAGWSVYTRMRARARARSRRSEDERARLAVAGWRRAGLPPRPATSTRTRYRVGSYRDRDRAGGDRDDGDRAGGDRVGGGDDGGDVYGEEPQPWT